MKPFCSPTRLVLRKGQKAAKDKPSACVSIYAMPDTQNKICLNMIVKNEAKVIERCLASVKPIIHAWVIVDTGSTDGTQEIIRAFLSDIPGEIHDRPWKNFAHNRNEAIHLAKGAGDYLFVIDADDTIEVERAPTGLTADSYQILVEDSGTQYWRTHFFLPLGFHYEGVLHEGLISASNAPAVKLNGLIYHRIGGGHRSQDKDKYRKDAAILEEALRLEPKNTRYAFYLAQSWRDAGEFEKAIHCYKRRLRMGGWAEEVFVSLLEIGNLYIRLGRDCFEAFIRAYEFRPTRAEPLCNLAAYLREKGRQKEAYLFAKTASEIPKPDDVLFVDSSVYKWRALDEYAVAAFWCGRFEEALAANTRLLLVAPIIERARIQKNIDLCRRKAGITISFPTA